MSLFPLLSSRKGSPAGEIEVGHGRIILWNWLTERRAVILSLWLSFKWPSHGEEIAAIELITVQSGLSMIKGDIPACHPQIR